MNLAQLSNLLEAFVWFSIAAILLVKSRSARIHARTVLVLAVSFAIFGLTDLIEIQSGAWWRPTWLLALKALCVVSFVLCHVRYLRTGPASEDDTIQS